MGFAIEEQGICAAENVGSGGHGSPRLIGHPEGTETSPVTARKPARVALRCPSLCQIAAEMREEAPVQDFPGNRHDRIYEPAASAGSKLRNPRRRCAPPLPRASPRL